jgi:CheY-like chemotaxis protein
MHAPTGPQHPPPVAVSEARVPWPPTPILRVLALDDNPGVLALYQETFEEDGLAVDVAASALPLEMIRQLQPNLILLECRIAGADGCALMRQLRQDRELGHVPCVVCTGLLHRVRDLADELAKWDVAVITKPFDLDTLKRTVRAALEFASVTPVSPPSLAVELTPQALARFHDRYVAALWRGDDVADVTDWLEAHWTNQGPPAPDSVPDAVSFLGETGHGGGMRWYQPDLTIFGYPPGTHRGCYQLLPTDLVPPIPGPSHRTEIHPTSAHDHTHGGDR